MYPHMLALWLNGAAQSTVHKAMSWPSPWTARELKKKQARDEDKVQITYLETQLKVLAAEWPGGETSGRMKGGIGDLQ